MRESDVSSQVDWHPNYRWRRVLDRFLLTADHGTWTLLSSDDFAEVQAGYPSKAIFQELTQKGLIRTTKNRRHISAMKKAWTAPHRGGPFLHIVATTRRCNLNCCYCHASARPVHADGEDLSVEVARKIVGFVFQSPSESVIIELQGGEPLLNLSIVKFIVRHVEQLTQKDSKRVSFDLVSNLTLMNQKAVEFLKQHDVHICSSIDGPKSVHDLNRRIGNRGTFDLVMKKKRIMQNQNLQVPFLTVFTRQTLPHYREIVDFSANQGEELLCVNPVNPLGYARQIWDEIGYDCDTYLDYYRRLLDYTFTKMSAGHFIIDRRFLLGLNKLTSSSDVRFTDFRNPCGAVFGQIAYDVNGDVYPCDEARGIPELKLGNVYTHSYDEIACSPKTMELVRSSVPDDRLCQTCAYKPFCGVCPVINYAEKGDFRSHPPNDPRCRFSTFLFDYLFSKIIREPEDIQSILRYRLIKQAFFDAGKNYEENLAESTGHEH